MKIKYEGYNIPEIDIEENITAGTKTKIGTADQYDNIMELTQKSGVFQVNCLIGNVAMGGTCLVNRPSENYIDFGCVCNFDYTPTIVAGTMEKDASYCYVTLTITTLS